MIRLLDGLFQLVYLRGQVALLFNQLVQQDKPDHPEYGVANSNYQHAEPHSRVILIVDYAI